MAESQPSTARVWLTDGSGAPFSDLDPLPATHPTTLGGLAAYKGCVDPEVAVGAALIEANTDDVFVPEAEWCITFPADLQLYRDDPARVDLATPVVLQGLIEGKWLNRFIGSLAWRPASVGNNLLAAGPGIRTTLGAIEAGAVGEALVTYQYERDGQVQTQVQRATLADLRGQNILELVRAVFDHCRQSGQEVDWVDCSAIGVTSAVVNEPDRLQAAMRASGLGPADLTTLAAFQRVLDRFAHDIADDGIGVPPNTEVTISVRDDQQEQVGQGQLSWRAQPIG